jgi:hypothetical protein
VVPHQQRVLADLAQVREDVVDALAAQLADHLRSFVLVLDSHRHAARTAHRALAIAAACATAAAVGACRMDNSRQGRV